FLLKVARAWKGNGKHRCLAQLYEGHALYHLDNSAAVLHDAMASDCPANIRDEYTYLQGLSFMQLNRGAEAADRFHSVGLDSVLRRKADQASVASLTP